MTWAEFDVKAMANQDKNSPAVIMYSLGNEIFEGTSNNRARRVSRYCQKPLHLASGSGRYPPAHVWPEQQ